MLQIVRMTRTLLRARRRDPLGPLETSVLPLRVLPVDIDINRHLTNAKYLAAMDLGRADLVARNGMLRAMRRHRWMPVVGSVSIRFRRSIAPLRRYSIHTRLIGWDGKWLFLEQRFEIAGDLAAIALVKGAMLGAGATVPPEEILREAGHGIGSPPLPESVRSWLASEEALRAESGAGR